MTRPERDYDEILSRVLHSTLDPIEPAGDGLSKIQRRIAEPWLQRQWSLLRNELTALGWLVFVRCEPFLNQARSSLAAFAVRATRRLRSAAAVLSAAVTRTASGRHKHAAEGDGPASVLRRWWLGPTVTWLRPALAVAGAVVIVVVAVFTLSNVRETLSPEASANRGSFVTGSSHGARNDQGSIGGHGNNSQPASSSGAGTSPAGKEATKPQSGRNAPASASSCSSATAPSPTPSPPASPTPSPSPSPTVSPTPSPTGSPTSSGGPAPPPASPDSQVTGAGPSCAPHPVNGPS
jgi:hypothetical protein